MAEIVQGWSEYQRKLKALTESIRRRLLERAVLLGAQIALVAAKALAPRRSGELIAGMAIHISQADGTHSATAYVGWNKKQFYGLFAEKGTFRQTARPFLRPALDSNRERIVRTMRATIIQSIREAVR